MPPIFLDEKNPRGIPKAPFITDVEEYLGGANADVEATLKSFQDALAKYRYMDSSLTQRRASLEEKNSGYPKDSGYGRILAREKGR